MTVCFLLWRYVGSRRLPGRGRNGTFWQILRLVPRLQDDISRRATFSWRDVESRVYGVGHVRLYANHDPRAASTCDLRLNDSIALCAGLLTP
jgi:hypothetical protein